MGRSHEKIEGGQMRSQSAKGILLPKGNQIGLKVLAASIFLSQLTGCGDFKKETVTTNTVPVEVPVIKEQTYGDAKFNLIASEIPHQYQMVVTWPSDIKSVVIEDDGKKVFTTVSGNQHILSLKDNTRFNLRVFTNDGEKPVLIGEFQGATPSDYTFSGNVELKEDTTIEAHRVFFINKAKIQTNGKALVVSADQIVSDDAEVFSFNQGTKAGIETSGASGGLVHLKSKEASGHMKVTLRGQHGGDGRNGLPWEIKAADGGGGRGGAHDCLRPPLIGGPLKCWCTRTPDNGGDGAAGAKGRSGTPAGRGGNSGKIIVEIKEPSQFVVEPFQEIGFAGIPGKGGPGQEGGNGGPAGDPSSSECSSARNGNKGATGANGDDAPQAMDGSTETLCISIGQGEGKCQY